MRRSNKDKKPILPTEEEFLRYVPKRINLQWKVNSDGLVEIKVPKFESDFGKSFCRIIKKDTHFAGNMDKLGSVVWQKCDGVNTVKDILEIIKNLFPDEKNVDQRLYLFLQQMYNLKYLDM
jgi:hypothetical protein